MKCNKQLFILKNKYQGFLFFPKIQVLQTYPPKMNLIPEIQMDQKRNLETLTSTLPIFPR
jgi:hypothetical protein